MQSAILEFIDWFIRERARRSRSDLGRARTFVFTHIVGPTTGASIVVFLFLADPHPGWHVPVIGAGIASFWLLPFLLRATADLRLIACISVQTLISVTLFGVYNYGGVSSPFLPWLLIALANGFFYLSERPITVLVIFVCNVAAFIAIWYNAGTLPARVPMDQMTGVGMVSVASATLYMAWLAIYYGMLLASESALEREAQSHRHTAERLAAARDKAERASKEKSIFLAKMSHELRTPLNAVIGYSEILQEEADLSKDEQRSKDLARINSAGKHLLSLVTDVLDITRIESNEIELQISEFDVRRLIEDVLATAQPLIETNGNRLEVRIDPNVGAMQADELRLRQAALNLMSNAAKFTQKGVIFLSCKRYRTEGGDWIEIEVRDTGIGIKREDLKNLFQDFRQLASRNGSKAKGTGLGLALSQKLCNMMGGGIFADSEIGHGATFTIRVPAKTPVRASSQPAETDAARSAA